MIYRLVLSLRHLAYDKGWKKSEVPEIPSVSVGNVTVGGTGKTPMTELILQRLLGSDAWGYRNIAVLSRGYGRKSKGYRKVDPEGNPSMYGDEPLQIARKFLSVTVAVDKDRLHGCSQLAADGADVVVLDDAFQYRALRPSLSIVLVDFNRPVFQDRLLPWGRLRDLPSRLLKADVVVVTKCPAFLTDHEMEQWREKLKLTGQKLFFTTVSYCQPEPVFPEGDRRYTYAHGTILVSGIAKDGPLADYLSDTYRIIRKLSFPDHHPYGKADIRSIMACVKAAPTACVMTTEKDAQRLREAKNVSSELRSRLFYLPIRAEFLTPEMDADFTETLLDSIK